MSARKRVLLVIHSDDGRNDRAAQHLVERGVEIEWCWPARGELLPKANGGFDGAVVYGGLESVNSKDSKPYLKAELDWIDRWLAADKPFLGICLGGQLLAHSLGARVGPHPEGLHEYGFVEVTPTEAGRTVFPGPIHLYQAHYEGFDLPQGAELLAYSQSYPHQAFRYGARAFGFQFHPETTPEIMKRWLTEDAGSDRMTQPGVDSLEKQAADSRLHDAPMDAWFRGFLDRWLDQA